MEAPVAVSSTVVTHQDDLVNGQHQHHVAGQQQQQPQQHLKMEMCDVPTAPMCNHIPHPHLINYHH